jgi:hypothetical protein
MERDLELTETDYDKTEKKRRYYPKMKKQKIVLVTAKAREESNRRVAKGLRRTLKSALDDEGADIYTYFNFHRPSKKLRCRRVPGCMYKYIVIIIVLALQISVPLILVITQFVANPNFVPTSNNFWFKLTGFITMNYSTAVMRKQIVDQVGWIIVDYSRILKRIDPGGHRPSIKWLYVGLYFNLFMIVVIVTTTYLLFCSLSSILDLILNMMALNFVLGIDNEAFGMMPDYARVKEIIEEETTEAINDMVAKADRKGTRIASNISFGMEHAIFYAIVLYSLILPLIFLFYEINIVEFGVLSNLGSSSGL